MESPPVLHLVEDKGNVEAICPFCKKEIQDTYFITDRCSIGWLWCNNCEKTGILDYPIGNNPQKELERHLTLKKEDCKIYDIPLLKIKRTTGNVLFLKKKEFSEKDISAFFFSIEKYSNCDIPEFILEKYGIVLEPFGKVLGEKYLFTKDYILKNGFSHLLSLPVDSYILENPKIPYPKGFNTEPEIYTFIQLENGKTEYLS